MLPVLLPQVRLLNYRHDGTTFWNNLHIAPVRNANGEVRLASRPRDMNHFKPETARQVVLSVLSMQVVFYVGVQLDITLPEGQSRAEEVQNGGARLCNGDAHAAEEKHEELPLAAPTIDPQAKYCQRSVVGTVRPCQLPFPTCRRNQ